MGLLSGNQAKVQFRMITACRMVPDSFSFARFSPVLAEKRPAEVGRKTRGMTATSILFR